MEQKIGIVTDSSSDLLPIEAGELGIEIIPLSVHFGTDTYRDGELSAAEFWDKAAGPLRPGTSQPAVGTFEEAFAGFVDEGQEVLCLTVTAVHSGTFNTAQLAAKRFERAVEVVDSESLSLGLGVLAVAAAQSAHAGSTMPALLAQQKEMLTRMQLLIIFDTLEYLRLGGRADGFIAVAERMTRALNIKVIVNVVDGQLRLLGAARSFKAALRRVLNQVERVGPLEQLAVVHTRNQGTAEQFADQLAERTGFSRDCITVRETGAVLSTHAGPGIIGVLAVALSPIS